MGREGGAAERPWRDGWASWAEVWVGTYSKEDTGVVEGTGTRTWERWPEQMARLGKETEQAGLGRTSNPPTDIKEHARRAPASRAEGWSLE